MKTYTFEAVYVRDGVAYTEPISLETNEIVTKHAPSEYENLEVATAALLSFHDAHKDQLTRCYKGTYLIRVCDATASEALKTIINP